jgi:predicted porin
MNKRRASQNYKNEWRQAGPQNHPAHRNEELPGMSLAPEATAAVATCKRAGKDHSTPYRNDMKIHALTFAVLGAFSAIASAQTAVKVYGLIDTGIVTERGGAAGSVTKLTSGISLGSRIGFTGSEDLGGGLSAIFTLENGFSADTGTLGQGGLIFGRQAFVGLKGDFGTVTFGRQYTPEYVTLGSLDPFGTGYAGTAANLMLLTGDGSSRMTNAIKYVSPTMSGVTGELAYGFGEVAGRTGAGRQIGVALSYANGPLSLRLGHHNRNNDTATASNTENTKNTLLSAMYDFGVAKAHLGYAINKGLNSGGPRNSANPFGYAVAPVPTSDSKDILVGVTVPLGLHKLMASYVRKNDETARDQDADQFGIGYAYALSKRTELFSTYARIKNKNGAGYTVGGAIEPGSGDKAFNVGIRHNF